MSTPSTPSDDARRNVIVIGGSAGAVEALTRLVHDLSADLPAAVLVALHFSREGHSLLPRILGRSSGLPVVAAADGQRLRPGCVYVARPNWHLLVEDSVLRLSLEPRENGYRPAVNALFRSAAAAYGARVIGVVLSGALDDGAAGLAAIKRAGGLTVVQDPHDALYPSMPLSALATTQVDHTVSIAAMGALLSSLVDGAGGGDSLTMSNNASEQAGPQQVGGLPLETPAGGETGLQVDDLSPLTCPECGGVLLVSRQGEVQGFRCHVGHVYSPETLVASQREAIENALWAAVRALRERSMLMNRMAQRARDHHHPLSAERYEGLSSDAEHSASLLRDLVLRDLGTDGVIAEEETPEESA